MDKIVAAATLARCFAIRQRHFAPTLFCAYPRRTLPVRVTPASCALSCAHCGGHYLQKMVPLTVALQQRQSMDSFLVSGGCDRAGRVPFEQSASAIAQLIGKRNFHVGLIDDEQIDLLALLADKVSFDFIGDTATIKTVLGLEKDVADYCHTYQALQKRCQVVPHICIGLYGGELRGEYHALELLHKLGAAELTFIVFIPTPDTRFAQKQPPPLAAVLALLCHARQLFPNSKLHLGCMRPGGRYRRQLDRLAVAAGINTIVNPTPNALSFAHQKGLKIITKEECCVF